MTKPRVTRFDLAANRARIVQLRQSITRWERYAASPIEGFRRDSVAMLAFLDQRMAEAKRRQEQLIDQLILQGDRTKE